MDDQQLELHRGESKRGGFIFHYQKKTVHDPRTGLFWLRNANYWVKPMMWHDAVNRVNRMNLEEFGGSTGWRLPTREELIAISIYAISAQSDNPKKAPFEFFLELGFDNVMPEWYWSSTPETGAPNSDPASFKYCVNMKEPDRESFDVTDKFYVWPVSDSSLGGRSCSGEAV